VRVDLEGEIVEGVLAGQDVLIQQDTGPEEIRPLEFRERRSVFDIARLHYFTCFINQSLAVLAHPIPYLSYQSLALHW